MLENYLFAVYMGGNAPKAHVEVHDLLFEIGPDIESCYQSLKEKWFGAPESCHIDGYIKLDIVDGYKLTLIPKTEPTSISEDSNKIWAINMGAYEPGQLVEKHAVNFYVATNFGEAVKRAKNELLQGLTTLHKDNIIDVDNYIDLSNHFQNWSVELSKTDQLSTSELINCYIPLK